VRGVPLGIEIHEDCVGGELPVHGAFLSLVFVVLDHVEGLLFPVVLEFVLGVLFVSHGLLLLFDTVAPCLHDFEDGFVDSEIFSFGVAFVLFEFLFHLRAKLIRDID